MANFLQVLKTINEGFMWIHKCENNFYLDLQLVQGAFIKNAVSFTVINNDGEIVTYFAHTCPTQVKQKCTCYLIEEHLIRCPRKPKFNPNYFSCNTMSPYVSLFRSFHMNRESTHIQYILLDGQDVSINAPFRNPRVIEYLSPFQVDPFLQRSFSIICGDETDLNPPPRTITDDDTPIIEILPTVYDDELLDNMLFGKAILDKDQMLFLNQLQNNRANFIRALLFRYMPVPSTSLIFVPDFATSPYSDMLVSNPSFRAGRTLYERELSHMPIQSQTQFGVYKQWMKENDRFHTAALQMCVALFSPAIVQNLDIF